MNPTIGWLVEKVFDVIDFINGLIEEIKAIIPDEVWETLAAIEEAVDVVTERSVFFSELQQTFSDIIFILKFN